jgi:hypothetical protein
MTMNRLSHSTLGKGGRLASASSLLSGKLGKTAILLALVAAVLVAVVLVTPVLAANFSDVFSDTYDNPDYPAAVSALSDMGVINGFDDGTFKPHDPVTRQQFAKMIVKLLGYPVTGDEICPFVDVLVGTSATDPFYPDKYVAVCAANGITQGTDGTHFAPYNNITRAQVVSMVIRAAQHSGIPLENPSAAYYAGTIQNSNFRNLSDPKHGVNVQIAEMNGLFWGIWPDRSGAWDIYAKASRGEVAQILWRLYQKIGTPGSTTTTHLPGTTTTTRPPSTTTTTQPSTTTTTLSGTQLERYDDFSDPSTGNWPNLSGWSDWYYYHYLNGSYAVELQPADSHWLFCTYNALDLTGTLVEADITLTNGDSNCGAGLLARYQDSNNFYLFEFDPDGYYALYKRAAGTWTRLVGWTYSPYIGSLGSPNHVAFSVFGNALTAQVNGYVICSATDSTLTHGSAGFYTEALGASQVKALFDNVAVWSLFGVL